MVTQHFAKFSVVHTAVGILMDNMFLCTSLGFRAILLLLGGPTKYQHNSWKNIIRQVQKSSLFLIIFHNITNVAGTDTKKLSAATTAFCAAIAVSVTASIRSPIPGFLGSQPASRYASYHFLQSAQNTSTIGAFRNKWLVVAGLR